MSLYSLVFSNGQNGQNDGIIEAIPAGGSVYTPRDATYNYNSEGIPTNVGASTINVQASPLGGSNAASGIINVVDNFDWTTTPHQNDGFDLQIPSATVTEFIVNKYNFIRGLAYYISAFTEGAINNIGNVLGAFSQVPGIRDVNSITSRLNSFKPTLAGASNLIESYIQGVAPNTFRPSVQGKLSPWLEDIDGLYSVRPSGFSYLFPYFDPDRKTLQNTTSEINLEIDLGPIGKLSTNELKNTTIGNLSQFTKLSEPGVYVETPQMFDNGSTSKQEAINIKFPLLNTLSPGSISQNYQLLWLLIYQNRSYRKNKIAVEPPRIYRVNVAGTKYMHFAYMDRMSVQFVGNRRTTLVTAPSPTGGDTTINVVIPDAYQVDITFRSLTSDMANLMLENLVNSR